MTSAQSHRKILGEYLSQYRQIDVLVTVYAYMQFMQFEGKLPRPLWHPILEKKSPYEAGLSEWALDVLAREALVSSPIQGGRPFGTWSQVGQAINRIRTIEERLWKDHPHRERDIILELHRIAHRQFPWQRPINHPAVARYFRVYGDESLAPIVYRQTGLNVRDLFRVGVGLTGHFLNKPTLKIPIQIELHVDAISADKFLRRFATTAPALRTRILRERSTGINWAYSSNPLRDTPLIAGKMDDGHHYVCPVPSFLLQRLTSGVYYELVGDASFANAFGKAYQRYLGEVMSRASPTATPFTILPEGEYGPPSARKDTADWILEDPSAALFVEAKTKRMVVQAKIDLEAREKLEEELNKLADAVVQLYKTIKDASGGLYPHWKPSSKPIFPVVVTLEEWFPQGPVIHQLLEKRIRSELTRLNFDLAMLDDMPYSIASADDFEMAVQVMAQRTIRDVMLERTSIEKREWLLAAVLTNSFSKELEQARMLFPEIWEEILPGHDKGNASSAT